MRTLATAVALLAVATASAEPRPSREAESGVLDVPYAESVDLGGAMVSGELRLDLWGGKVGSVGPSPLTLVTGLSHGLEIGVFAHEGDLPGNPKKAPYLLGAALKLHLLDAERWWPAIAVDVVGDQLNSYPLLATRAIVSSRWLGPIRLTGTVGPELDLRRPISVGAMGGLAVVARIRPEWEIAVEGLASRRGFLVGGDVTWSITPLLFLSAGANWRPTESVVRVHMGIGFSSPAPRRPEIVEAPTPSEVVAPPTPPPSPSRPTFTDETARLRLRIKSPPPAPEDIGRHLQWGPPPPEPEPEPATAPTPAPAPEPKPEPPSPPTKSEPPPSPPPAPEPAPATAPPKAERLRTPDDAQTERQPTPLAEPPPAPDPEHLQETELASIESLTPHPISAADAVHGVAVTRSPQPAGGGTIAGAVENPPPEPKSCCINAPDTSVPPLPEIPYEVPPNAPTNAEALHYEVSGPSNPALPDAVLFWDGQSSVEVTDGLSLTVPPGTSGLGKPQAEALSVFVNRAARDGAGLIVWGRAPRASDLADAAVRAKDIAQIAASMAHLPTSRVLARATEWPETQVVDVVVLRTAATTRLPPSQDERLHNVLTSQQGREAELRSQSTRLDGIEDALAAQKTALASRTTLLNEREQRLTAQEKTLAAQTGGPGRKAGKVAPVGAQETSLLAEENAHRAEERKLTEQQASVDVKLAKKTKQETILHGRLDWLRVIAEKQKSEAARAKAQAEVLDALASVLSERGARLKLAKEKATLDEKRLTEREARLAAWEARLASAADPVEALEVGAAGKKQLSAAVRKHEHELQRCLDAELKLAQKTKASHVLRITVDEKGHITQAGLTDAGGTPTEKCLQEAAASWRFPAGDEPYELDIPVRTSAGGGP